MSTCPDDALHHVYLDDEIPPEYVGEYASHTGQCARCRKKLERIEHLRAAIKRDSDEITLSEKRLDAGYTRLMSNLRYRRVSRVIQKTQASHVFRQALPLTAAAALVFSLTYVFLLDGRAGSQPLASAPPRAESTQSAQYAQGTPFIAIAPMAEPYSPHTAGAMTAAGALPYIPDIDVFKPSFVYTQSVYARGVTRGVWVSGVISFALPEQESGE